jgi:hypothetical protein
MSAKIKPRRAVVRRVPKRTTKPKRRKRREPATSYSDAGYGFRPEPRDLP